MSSAHRILSGGLPNRHGYLTRHVLGASGSRVFRENQEEIRPCVWLACLNFRVKIETGTMRKYDAEDCDVYLLQPLDLPLSCTEGQTHHTSLTLTE